METLEQVKRANAINEELDSLEQQKKDLEDKIATLTSEREVIYTSLLDYIKSTDKKEEQYEDLFLNYFSKNDITWLDDAGLLAKLKESNLKDYIKVVTKESVDKNALKKAFKTNESLKESLKEFYGDKLTEYVTVTTSENHQRMLEHIEESKNK